VTAGRHLARACDQLGRRDIGVAGLERRVRVILELELDLLGMPICMPTR
jgi:hypothetical protein